MTVTAKVFFLKKSGYLVLFFIRLVIKRLNLENKSKYVAEDQCSLNVNRKLCRCKANKKRKQIQSVISFF